LYLRAGCSRDGFFSERISIRNTLDIEDHGDSTKDPSEWWVLGLELCNEDKGLASGLIQVDWAHVNSLLFLALNNHCRLAVDDGNNRELLLGLRLFEAA